MIAYNLKYNDAIGDWVIFEYEVPPEWRKYKLWDFETARRNLELYRTPQDGDKKENFWESVDKSNG